MSWWQVGRPEPAGWHRSVILVFGLAVGLGLGLWWMLFLMGA